MTATHASWILTFTGDLGGVRVREAAMIWVMVDVVGFPSGPTAPKNGADAHCWACEVWGERRYSS